MVIVVSPLVALGFYEYEQTDRVYRGVSALGVDLSGLDGTDAEQLIAARAAELTARPVLVRAGKSEWPTDWHRLGLDMPVGPIVDKAIGVGRQGSVLDRLYGQARALKSGVAIPVEETLDETAIRAFVATAGEQVDRPVRNARLDMQPDLTFALTTAQAGQALDQDAAVKLLLAASQTGIDTVDIPVLTVQPTTTDEMRLPAKQKAEKVLAGPLTLTGGDKTWTIDRQLLASALVFTGGPGVPIEVGLDADKLRPAIDKIAAEVVQEPKDATVEWVNGGLRATVQGQDGQRMDADAALKQVASAAESGVRSVALPLSVTKPAVDGNNLDALGVKELIDSASTSFAGGLPEKIHNVRLAASRLNNQLIAPGAKFSFNKALGPTTLDNGYQVAYGIESSGDSGHKTVPSVAGGICQVATTLFQPVFWSGYQLEERHWHLYWIPAYASKGGAVGLDATVDEEVNLDLQFVNNSSSYLMIHTKTDDSSVTFELYGTKPDWNVKVDGPTLTDQKKADPTPVTEHEPSLPAGKTIQVEAARDGFTASFVRNVTAKDGNVRTLKLRSDYVPSQNVTLVGTGGQTAEAPARPNPVADGG